MATSLQDILLSSENRPKVLRDCVQLLENEVKRKRGVSGLAIKGGFKVLQRLRPNFVGEAMDGLLNEFVEKLDPVHRDWELANRSPAITPFLQSRGTHIADTLLGITDAKAKRNEFPVIAKTYFKLRPLASKQIQEALPAVGNLLMKYV